jgi:RNA polymerase sigma factor (sigma-70 family)
MDRESEDLVSFCLYNRGGDNRPELERMRTILSRAIRHELTDRQRECMTLYYLEGMKMKDIARSLCLSKSTVSRHISAATLKLRHIADYYVTK